MVRLKEIGMGKNIIKYKTLIKWECTFSYGQSLATKLVVPLDYNFTQYLFIKAKF